MQSLSLEPALWSQVPVPRPLSLIPAVGEAPVSGAEACGRLRPAAPAVPSGFYMLLKHLATWGNARL